MRTLMQQKKSLAIVVDEFGGTAGLVTLEDLVEEIFGDIEDEHDTQNLVARKVSDDEFEFSGRMEIERINEEFGLDIPGIGRLSHDRRVYLVSLSDIAEARRDRGNRELPVYYFTTKSYENRTCTHENREIRDFFVLSLPI